MRPIKPLEFAMLLKSEYFSKILAEPAHKCDEGGCDQCDPITSEDVICSKCSEHAQLRENTGTECCGGRSRFE